MNSQTGPHHWARVFICILHTKTQGRPVFLFVESVPQSTFLQTKKLALLGFCVVELVYRLSEWLIRFRPSPNGLYYIDSKNFLFFTYPYDILLPIRQPTRSYIFIYYFFVCVLLIY